MAPAKYKLLSTIPLTQRTNIVDLAHDGYNQVYISVRSTAVQVNEVSHPGMRNYYMEGINCPINTRVLPYLGDYIDAYSGRYVAYGTRTSVYAHSGKLWPPPKEESDQNDDHYIPQGMVATRSGFFLICLWNNRVGERSLGKVVSDNGRLNIFTDKNQPLFICPTYIAENGNGDICVSDVGAVVVTDAGGMLRFRYQGISANSNFEPYGLCCNSACNIIIADMKNDRIHVIDKDGGFLYTVQYEGIKMPRALCIDEKDNVYVGEWNTDSIKVLSY